MRKVVWMGCWMEESFKMEWSILFINLSSTTHSGTLRKKKRNFGRLIPQTPHLDHFLNQLPYMSLSLLTTYRRLALADGP